MQGHRSEGKAGLGEGQLCQELKWGLMGRLKGTKRGAPKARNKAKVNGTWNKANSRVMARLSVCACVCVCVLNSSNSSIADLGFVASDNRYHTLFSIMVLTRYRKR